MKFIWLICNAVGFGGLVQYGNENSESEEEEEEEAVATPTAMPGSPGNYL